MMKSPFYYTALFLAFNNAAAFVPRAALPLPTTHDLSPTTSSRLPAHPPFSTLLPSLLTSEEIPEYQTAQAFQDDVSLTDLTSDPFIQASLAITAIIITILFVTKSIITQMDDAVQQTALEFDRVMKEKYPKKWTEFIQMEEDLVGVFDREEKEGDRIQSIVEEMERLQKEEPAFFERAMRDVDNKMV